MKVLLSTLTGAVLYLLFFFAREANAEHCNAPVYRECNAECQEGTPGFIDCSSSCGQSNADLYDQERKCYLEHVPEQGEDLPEEQTEEPQQQPEQPRSTRPEQEDVTSDIPSPTLSTPVKRLVAGLDIKEGETVTAEQGEILLIDFRSGNYVEVNSGASFTFGEEETKTIFEVIKGSLRFIFEPTGKIKTVHTKSTVATIRGTDFVVNEGVDKTEVLVFDGNLAVSDINGQNTVDVGPGYKTEVKKGSKPTKPELFDSSKIDRWFDAITPENSQRQIGARTWTIVAVILVVGLAIIFFGIKKSIKLSRKKKKR